MNNRRYRRARRFWRGRRGGCRAQSGVTLEADDHFAIATAIVKVKCQKRCSLLMPRKHNGQVQKNELRKLQLRFRHNTWATDDFGSHSICSARWHIARAYFNRLVARRWNDLARVLISVVGSGHPLNIDGIGGGSAITTKICNAVKSDFDWADIDYFFAQVSVVDGLVDFNPPAATSCQVLARRRLEWAYILRKRANEIKIRAVNTGARIVTRVQTDGSSQFMMGAMGFRHRARIVGFHASGGIVHGHIPALSIVTASTGLAPCMDVAIPW